MSYTDSIHEFSQGPGERTLRGGVSRGHHCRWEREHKNEAEGEKLTFCRRPIKVLEGSTHLLP